MTRIPTGTKLKLKMRQSEFGTGLEMRLRKLNAVLETEKSISRDGMENK